jgi:mycofactocin precursor
MVCLKDGRQNQPVRRGRPMEYRPLSTPEFPLIAASAYTDAAQAPMDQTVPVEEVELVEEIEDELIIEDFTIDGICGVY